jgi:glutamate/tyrosine decarboxylase-like PLP-dependent enzyme
MKFLSLNKICLLKTSLTHYSIDKIASIIGLSQFIIALDKNLGMDINDLENKINSLSKKGYFGFIIVLTLGYSVTGTRDNYDKIDRFLKKLEKKYSNLKFYCFIDAASDGMVEPFFNKKFKPLNFSHIFSFVVDFHKFGMAAYPAGLVLYKKKLISLISKNISYLEEKDETLLGSRQGAVAVALWVLINFLGKEGFRKVYEKQFNNKTYFINEIKKIIPKIKITENKYSLILGLIFKDNKQIPQKLCNRYNIYPANVEVLFIKKNKYIEKKIKIYKICFMPYLRKKTVESFINNLNNSI